MSSWYKNTRRGFLEDDPDLIIGSLHNAASKDGWQVEPDQHEEWRASIEVLRTAITDEKFSFIDGVLAEYDFRRRGIRIDFILIARGVLFVLEFKRATLSASDRDQVLNYCFNLAHFHEITQRKGFKILPFLVSRKSTAHTKPIFVDWHDQNEQICRNVIETNSRQLSDYLHESWKQIIPKSDFQYDENEWEKWDGAQFKPSSTIIDATISLYGEHDVSAIKEHAVPKEAIDSCVKSVLTEIDEATQQRRNEIIVVSGAPGSGKTLVGLAIAFHEKYRNEAVFVTGNAPLVDVLNGALTRSYLKLHQQSRKNALGGFTRNRMHFVVKNADFKIVKAHRFLELSRRKKLSVTGSKQHSVDERILVFDEAQRTYAAGKHVNRHKLEEDEALLILREMSQGDDNGESIKSILVLLFGHNQHINTDETGAMAWIRAARTLNWHIAISDDTLSLGEFATHFINIDQDKRIKIEHTHLATSMRDQQTRNGAIERWVDMVMLNRPSDAKEIVKDTSPIYITRSLQDAKTWVQNKRIGEERCGLIASGQGRRLRPEGIFVDEKPDIVHWMLAPSDDVRSSNMLEQTQNQYQIQGLEIDYAVVCWDADLRRDKQAGWICHNVSGAGWERRTKEDETRRNSYRVLLTRSRKGMVIFVPFGDLTGNDPTRNPGCYDDIFNYLCDCGAQTLVVN
jgi:hypothetical protein